MHNNGVAHLSKPPAIAKINVITCMHLRTWSSVWPQEGRVSTLGTGHIRIHNVGTAANLSGYIFMMQQVLAITLS